MANIKQEKNISLSKNYMKYYYDLQMHSNLSDGDYPVEKVYRIAKKQGLKEIIITDHNICVGFDKKKILAKKLGMTGILGIEISTKMFDSEIHILGYAIKFKTSVLKNGLAKTVNGYNHRASLIVEKLKRHNIINLDFKQIKKIRGKNLAVTKYDLAKIIFKKLGIPLKNALQFINRGGAAYVPYGRWAISPVSAIRLIHQAGGLAILAHPGETYNIFIKKYGRLSGKKKFDQLITLLINNNLDGIEVYSPKNNTAIKRQCLQLAKKYHLVITGGSDWHGEQHHPEIKMGVGGLTKKNFLLFKNKIK